MKIKTTIFLLLFILFWPAAQLFNLSKPEAANYVLKGDAISAVHEDETQRLERITVETAIADGVNPTIPVYVITHESQWKPTAVGDHGLAHGVAQFHKATFDWMKKQADMPQLQYSSSSDQIVLLVWAIRHDEGSNWTTYRRLQSLK